MSGRALLFILALIFAVIFVWFMSIGDEVKDPNGPWGDFQPGLSTRP